MYSPSSKTSLMLHYLGVDIREVEDLRHLPHREATQRLTELKGRIHKGWRKAAFELHPDRTGNDPQKTALFQALTLLRDQFEDLRLAEPLPAPTAQIFEPMDMPPTPGVVFQTRPPKPPPPPHSGYRAATMKP
jgi:hypothetical protein